jgi:hypothetical protein
MMVRPQQGLGSLVPVPFGHTPGEIQGMQEHLASKTGLIDLAVRACTGLDDVTRSGWGSFYVYAQDASHEPVPTTIQFTALNSMFENLLALIGQADEWAAKLTQAGCNVPIVPHPPGPGDMLMKVISAVGGAAVTLGLVYGGVKLADIIASRTKKT